ncbi:MAG: hypothetical protein ACI9WS_002509 [Paraglaciecola psychrophila]|jgi:hypothetical protein
MSWLCPAGAEGDVDLRRQIRQLRRLIRIAGLDRVVQGIALAVSAFKGKSKSIMMVVKAQPSAAIVGAVTQTASALTCIATTSHTVLPRQTAGRFFQLAIRSAPTLSQRLS